MPNLLWWRFADYKKVYSYHPLGSKLIGKNYAVQSAEILKLVAVKKKFFLVAGYCSENQTNSPYGLTGYDVCPRFIIYLTL